MFKQAGALHDAEAIFNGCGELDPAQAVEVKVFGEAELVAVAGRVFARDLRDEREEPVGRRRVCAVGLVVRSAGAVMRGRGMIRGEPRGDGLAFYFAG